MSNENSQDTPVSEQNSPTANEIHNPMEAALAAINADDVAEPEAAPEAAEETVETKPGESVAEPVAEPDHTEESKSEFYAKLSELDRQNRLLRKQLKDVQTAAPQNDAPSVDVKALAQKDPLAALNEMGLGIDQILEAYTGAEPSSESNSALPKDVQAKLAKLDQLETQFREFTERQTKAQQEAQQAQLLKQETEKLGAVVETNVEKYEMVNATKDEGSLNLVLQVAAEIYNQEGEVPSYDRCLGLVETHLRENAKKQWEKASKLSFLKGFLTSTPDVVQLPTSAQKSPATVASKTLSPGQEDTPQPKELTKEDLFNQALNALNQ